MYRGNKVYGKTCKAIFLTSMIACSTAFASVQSIFHTGTPLKRNTSKKFVLAVKTKSKIRSLEELAPYLAKHNLVGAKLEVILSAPDGAEFKTLVQVQNQTRNKALSNMRLMERSKEILWAYPSFAYEGDPREETREENRDDGNPKLDDGDLLNLDDLEGFIPNDTQFEKQLHHSIIKSTQAWEIEQGSNDVIVAVTDDGVDLDHEDLKNSIWTNAKEIPGNDIDDDNNGFVDDVNGWDFSDDDNDPRPRSFSKHGTHVAGIIGAEMGNGIGVAGIAPKVKIMPIRFYGGANDYDGAIVAKSYAYAVENGAKIITTSYNINQFVGDPVYETAIAMAYDAGLLIFNSGGNNNNEQPKRVAFKELILVASLETETKDADKKSRFSNYGIGLDIAAPGHIFSTVNANEYDEKAGTSMASPAAAAVAALIWSQNPILNRDQVAALLLSAVDDVSAQNKKYVGKLGSGRINALKAVTSLTPVTPSLSVAKEQDQEGVIKLNVTGVFDSSINDIANWSISQKSADGTKTEAVEIASIATYKLGTNVLEISLGDEMTTGTFVVEASANLQGPFDNKMGAAFNAEVVIEKKPEVIDENDQDPEEAELLAQN